MFFNFNFLSFKIFKNLNVILLKSNLHFKTQRNQSLLSGVNYPKKNLNKPREDSLGNYSNNDTFSMGGVNSMSNAHRHSDVYKAPQIIGNTTKSIHQLNQNMLASLNEMIAEKKKASSS